MKPVVLDVPWSLCLSAGITTSCAKTDEPIYDLVAAWVVYASGPKEPRLGWGQITQRKVQFWGVASCDAAFRQNSSTTSRYLRFCAVE